MVGVIVSRCNLLSNAGLDTISSNDEVAIDPATISQLDAGFEVAVHFGNVVTGEDLNTISFAVLEEHTLEVATVNDANWSVVDVGNLVKV